MLQRRDGLRRSWASTKEPGWDSKKQLLRTTYYHQSSSTQAEVAVCKSLIMELKEQNAAFNQKRLKKKRKLNL